MTDILSGARPSTRQVILILAVGVLTTSTSAVLVRLTLLAANRSGLGFSLFLAASRLLMATLLLLPTWRQLRRSLASPSAYGWAIAAGLCLAGHFITWISSLSFTSIAASATIVTTTPVWIALLSWFWFREKPRSLTLAGIAIALGGGALIALGESTQGRQDTNPLLGDGLALVGAWLVSLYLLCGREAQKQGLTIGPYILMVYGSAAISLFPLPLLEGGGYLNYPLVVYGYVGLMALFPQLIGHTSINWAVRWISPTLVTLAILFEPLGSSLLAWLLFEEIPPLTVIWGGFILLIGVAIAVIGNRGRTA